MGWELKNMFLPGVPKPSENMQNLAHFEHFGSNRVGGTRLDHNLWELAR